ncbi:hypothetical protein N7468_008399 [Penicillium chermesinum]|uniref:Histone deacetylation protein Rxt3 n=1 Tax=Penicillium chermesinum TaxID=63820 RepID=A0A9W9NPN7_9EURO|nr:uncharacterized protein N7468_008399 [Penicillium chermesinum]KAJ5223857.1 hypothetical protein N7468_008399 [Penicillium chermesinum]
MDFFRRLQNSYPPRPSPLGSQESKEERPRSYPANDRREDNPRPSTRYEYQSPSSSAHVLTGASRSSHPLRESLSAHTSPTRNANPHPHRRHASLENRDHPHIHRRNTSQPQSRNGREGQQEPSASPTVGTRQMPPPSPPHPYGSRSQSVNAPPSLLARDAPSNQPHRPGSSMSISAMLGSDPERPARDAGSSLFSRPSTSSIFGTAPTSSAAAMSPPTAPARPSPLDQSLFRRSQTPEKTFSKPPVARPYRSGSGGGSSLLGAEQSKFGGLTRVPPSQYPEKPHSTHPSPQVSPADLPYEPRRMSFSGPIARPNSQPPNAEAPTRPPDRFDSGPRASSASYGGTEAHAREPHNRYSGLFGDRRSEEAARDRERDRASHTSDSKASLGGPTRFGSIYGERDMLERHSSASTWDQGRSHPSSPEAKRFPPPESSSGFGFGAIQSYTKSLGSQPGGSRQPPSIQTGHGQPPLSPRGSPYLGKTQTQPQRVSSTPTSAASTGSALLGLASAGEEGRRKGSDELLQHRNLLNVGFNGKRGGRASPLPQAVQGAQAPFINPSGEPGIKNELGRVFSGIGSGVGGVGGMATGSTGSGPSTPMISSPFKRDSGTGRSVNGEIDDTKISRPPSANGARRSRKSRDEDQMELEAAGLSGRGRRPRHAHQHHSHHHHHHHHHRHKAEEEVAALGGLHRPMSTNHYYGRTSTPADPAGHHHHHHHHHHHAPRPATIQPASPVREPRTVVNIEPLVSSVAHLPRHHLGSTLYNPRVNPPSAKASPESAKFGYTTTPLPLPRLEQRENCTFTVRVPRFRIDHSHREEICARRALWGTGVYTDDSDPVAAAIHSGFIRGAWGEDVDESMLDLEIKDDYQHAPRPKAAAQNGTDKEESESGPRLPPVPPGDKDLHITLLVLPRLEQYDSTVLFGIKSRKWDGRHDGMSFKVHAVDWVDDGVGRGEERNGEARRKRLRTLMQTGRICTGPAMAKIDELRRRGVQVTRTIDGQEQPTHVQPVS